MYKIIKILPTCAILEITGTRHTLRVLFKKPIDGDMLISIAKEEIVTLGLYMGKFVIDNDGIDYFNKQSLPSKKNPDFYLYGHSRKTLLFIENGEYLSIDSLKVMYDSKIIEKLSHDDCQRVGIIIGKTQNITDISPI